MKSKSLIAFFSLLLILFILHCCSKKQKVTSINITLEKDLEIGVSEGDENYMFGGIIDVEVDSQENIYVLDWKNKTVKKYDKDGRFLQNIGQKGQGPGEFSSILVDSCLDRNDRLYVVELRKVHIFVEKRGFANSFTPDFFPLGIMVNKQGKIILVGEKKDKIFHIYDQKGEYLDSFGELFPIPEKLRKLYNLKKKTDTRNAYLSDEGRLFVFNPFKYEMDVYQEKKLARRITRNSPYYKLPKLIKNEKGEDADLTTFAKILETDNHIFIWYATEVKDYVLGEERYIDIYDKKDYAFLGTTTIKEKGIPDTVRNNKIYFDVQDEETDFPKVVRYRIVLK